MDDVRLWKQDSNLRPDDDEDIGRVDWNVWLKAGSRDNILVTMSSNGTINTRAKAKAAICKIISALNTP
jgi:hypothetical protein